jgi:hypothetical protein
MAHNRFAPPDLPYTIRDSDLCAQILILLDPYDNCDILPTHLIAAHIGRGVRYTQILLNRMVRAKLLHRYTVIEDNYREVMKYIRTPAGARYLSKHGYPSSPVYDLKKASSAHQTLGSYIQSSLMLGVKADTNFTLETPRHILTDPRTPHATRNSKHPFSFNVNGHRLTPDWKPNILRRKHPKGAVLLLREDDRDTEIINLTSKNKDQDATTIVKKAQAWKTIFTKNHNDQYLFEEKYGISACLLLFTTINEEHKRNIMIEWGRVMGGPCSWALFKAIPKFKSLTKRIDPTTTVFDDPWDRIGHNPYSLKHLSEMYVPDPAIRERNIELIAQSNNKTIQALKDKQDGWA